MSIVEIPLTAPGMLFPAVSLLMLAYTNRFLGLASLVRHLHIGGASDKDKITQFQVDNLRVRIGLIRHAQALGILSLFACTGSLLLILFSENNYAALVFSTSLVLMMGSLAVSLLEIHLSVDALKAELTR